MAKKFRAPAAMRIARMDRQKFNEAVADGFYNCAPRTFLGTARLFDEDDLIALFYFARLTHMGINARLAGHLACNVRENLAQVPQDLRGTPNEPRISYLRGTADAGSCRTGYDPDHFANGMVYPLHGLVAFSMEFNIAQVRLVVRQGMQEEIDAIGEEEAD